MLPQLVKIKGMAFDLLFPRRCLGCGREGDYICHDCLQSQPTIAGAVCPRCGLPRDEGSLCSACAAWQASIDGIRSPFQFDGVIRQAVHHLKYQNLRALAEPLAALLQHYLNTHPLPADVLVPVPLHPRRLRERGYNQSRLLARELAGLTGLPVADNCLVRQRHTPPQAKSGNVSERWRNAAGSFACKGDGLRGRRVLLIDDVSTSGATLDACAAAAKAGGASSAWGLVLAREL